MISINDLKKDALLTPSFGVHFRIDIVFNISRQKNMYLIFLSLDRNNNLQHNKFLILLECRYKKFTSGDFYQEWLCFCNGKICTFNITHDDLAVLCLV
jgi:hypothetical protein